MNIKQMAICLTAGRSGWLGLNGDRCIERDTPTVMIQFSYAPLSNKFSINLISIVNVNQRRSMRNDHTLAKQKIFMNSV